MNITKLGEEVLNGERLFAPEQPNIAPRVDVVTGEQLTPASKLSVEGPCEMPHVAHLGSVATITVRIWWFVE